MRHRLKYDLTLQFLKLKENIKSQKLIKYFLAQTLSPIIDQNGKEDQGVREDPQHLNC